MSTHEAIQTLRTDTSKNHLTIVGEMQTISRQMSQSVGTELKQELPLLEDNLSQKIDNSQRSIENIVSQSSAAASQSAVAELNQTLSVLQRIVVNSVAQQIDSSRSSIEATVTNLSVEITSALSAHTTQQMTAILPETREGQRQLYRTTESLKSPIFGPSFPRSKKKRRKRDQDLVEQQPSGCKCSPSIGRIRTFPFYRYGFGKESEAFVIHKRSCPLWYQSQITRKYGVNFTFLQRLRIFGSLSVSRSPYASIFGTSISQNLTYRAVVPDDAPAFKVLRKYLWIPGFGHCQHCITSCSQDLRTVFQSGYGSPNDTLADGTTLIEVSYSSFCHGQ